jgi:hypothetical protein
MLQYKQGYQNASVRNCSPSNAFPVPAGQENFAQIKLTLGPLLKETRVRGAQCEWVLVYWQRHLPHSTVEHTVVTGTVKISCPTWHDVRSKSVLKADNFTFWEYADMHVTHGATALRYILNVGLRTRARFPLSFVTSGRAGLLALVGWTEENGEVHGEVPSVQAAERVAGSASAAVVYGLMCAHATKFLRGCFNFVLKFFFTSRNETGFTRSGISIHTTSAFSVTRIHTHWTSISPSAPVLGICSCAHTFCLLDFNGAPRQHILGHILPELFDFFSTGYSTKHVVKAWWCPTPYQSRQQKLPWDSLHSATERKSGSRIVTKSFTSPESP